MSKKHFDQHIHSSFSFDSAPDNTIIKIAEKAISKGLSGIAVTDHLDPLWPPTDYMPDFDVMGYQAALLEAEAAFSGQIRFSKGIELGLKPGQTLDICSEVVSGFPYDFVIGSVHCSDDRVIPETFFPEGIPVYDILESYYALILDSIKIYKDYDVLGHLNSIERHTEELSPESLYMPFVDEILKLAVSDGKGLEINTSSFGK